jgi:hypothetical protein
MIASDHHSPEIGALSTHKGHPPHQDLSRYCARGISDRVGDVGVEDQGQLLAPRGALSWSRA